MLAAEPRDPSSYVLKLAVLGLKRRMLTYEYTYPGVDWHEVRVRCNIDS